MSRLSFKSSTLCWNQFRSSGCLLKQTHANTHMNACTHKSPQGLVSLFWSGSYSTIHSAAGVRQPSGVFLCVISHMATLELQTAHLTLLIHPLKWICLQINTRLLLHCLSGSCGLEKTQKNASPTANQSKHWADFPPIRRPECKTSQYLSQSVIRTTSDQWRRETDTQAVGDRVRPIRSWIWIHWCVVFELFLYGLTCKILMSLLNNPNLGTVTR